MLSLKLHVPVNSRKQATRSVGVVYEYEWGMVTVWSEYTAQSIGHIHLVGEFITIHVFNKALSMEWRAA